MGNGFTDLFDLPFYVKKIELWTVEKVRYSIDGTIGFINAKHDRVSSVRNAVLSHQGLALAIPGVINRLHMAYLEGRNACSIQVLSISLMRLITFEETNIHLCGI